MADLFPTNSLITTVLTSLRALRTHSLITDGTTNVEVDSGSKAMKVKLEKSGLGAKTWVHGPLTVTTSPVQVKVGGSQLTNCNGILIYNDGNQIVYLGSSSSVTTANGGYLNPGDFRKIDRSPDGTLACWAVVASGTTTLRVEEVA